MGLRISKLIEENFTKQQEFMLSSQTLQMKRQLEMQNQMRIRMMSAQIARAREMFNWLTIFVVTVSPLMILGGIKKKSAAPVIPLVPISFIYAYQYDLCYGSKLNRIQKMAEDIMVSEEGLLAMPQGLPTIDGIDKAAGIQFPKKA